MSAPRHFTRATQPWQPTSVNTHDVDTLHAVLGGLRSTVVLTGAGLSTDSGVPDYRGPDAPRATPMLFDEFVGEVANRQRYWARSFQGWAHMGRALPNAGHRALVAWERLGVPTELLGVISQNVDGLHSEAGQHRLVDIHGRIDDVICLDCGKLTSRAVLQDRLRELNPHLPDIAEAGHAELRPDGDAVVEEWQDFVIAPCASCGGVLKPDVVFFGESAPPAKVERCLTWVDQAESLLVAGSSLTVMSGLRFVRQAARRGVPVLIVNRGATRGDDLADVRVEAGTSETLSALVGQKG